MNFHPKIGLQISRTCLNFQQRNSWNVPEKIKTTTYKPNQLVCRSPLPRMSKTKSSPMLSRFRLVNGHHLGRLEVQNEPQLHPCVRLKTCQNSRQYPAPSPMRNLYNGLRLEPLTSCFSSKVKSTS